MAHFFTRRTVEDALDDALPEAQLFFLHQLQQDKKLQTAWEQHAATCSIAQEDGLVPLAGKKKENEEHEQHLYGQTNIAFGCSCQQVIFTVNDKGGVRAQTNPIGQEQNKGNAYLIEKEKEGKKEGKSPYLSQEKNAANLYR